MSEDLYAKVALTKTVRFHAGEKEDGKTEVSNDIDNVVIYDNPWAESRTPPKPEDIKTEDQQQITSVSVSPGKSNPVRAAAVFLGLLCLVLMAAVAVLVVLWIQGNAELTRERDELQTSFSEMKILNHNLVQNMSRLERERDNLTDERDKLQASFSEMKTLNHDLDQNVSRLERERDKIAKEKDELQQQIEKTRCPDEWIKFNGSCYLRSTSGKNWRDSKNDCESHGAQLVIISSIAEQAFISSFLTRVWIGLERTTGRWKWINGERLTKQYWAENQPDNHQNKENCVEIKRDYGPIDNWNNAPCNRRLKFICEKILE